MVGLLPKSTLSRAQMKIHYIIQNIWRIFISKPTLIMAAGPSYVVKFYWSSNKSSRPGSPSHCCGTRNCTRSWTMRARSLSAFSIKTLMISSLPRKQLSIYIPRIYVLRLTSWMPGSTLVSTVRQAFSSVSYQWQIHISYRRGLQIRLRNLPNSLWEGCRGSLRCPW